MSKMLTKLACEKHTVIKMTNLMMKLANKPIAVPSFQL